MKKTSVLLLSVFLLTACSQEKQDYYQAVLEQMQNDPDIKDYRINPATMADCIVDISSSEMDGFFPFDPKRRAAYVGYTKLLSLKQAKEPQSVLAELRQIFGSGQNVARAQQNYSESVMRCLQGLVSKAEGETMVE